MFKPVQKTILACMVCLFAILLMVPGVASADNGLENNDGIFATVSQGFVTGFSDPGCTIPVATFPNCDEACDYPGIVSCEGPTGCFLCAQ